MKAIILAGGTGSRLYPATKVLSKQLLHVFDKPMVYYPLSTIMLAGIRDILIISSPDALVDYEKLFKNGEHLGLNISYQQQPKPNGIAQAFLLGEQFIDNKPIALILGDNIFYGDSLNALTQQAARLTSGAQIFGYYVQDPQRYGVAEIDEYNKVISLEEKPAYPKSPYAVTGLYFYDHQVVDIAKQLKPSARGELEITDINNFYLAQKKLNITKLSRGVAWLDTGTHQSLLEASNFIATIEHRQGLKIGCIEEVAYLMKFINNEQLLKLAYPIRHTNYGQYLNKLITCLPIRNY
jgi:glucose-1-phosphate thymidylyltransferase